MPSFYIVSYDDVTGEVVLSNGDTFNISEIPGNGFSQSRINKIVERVQNSFDVRVRQSDIPVSDPERTWTAQQFDDTYAGRMFLDGQDVVSRSVIISATFDGTRLHFSSRNV